jgi:hypothetical protein
LVLLGAKGSSQPRLVDGNFLIGKIRQNSHWKSLVPSDQF